MGLSKPFAFMGSTSGGDPGVGYGNPPYDQDLIAYYDFGSQIEGSWTGSATLAEGDIVTDLSGNGLHSTLHDDTETFTYHDNIGKGVIGTTTKGGGYFYMPVLTGSFADLTEFTFEFVGNIPLALTNDNVIVRFDGLGTSRVESNLQQYGGTPVPNRISYDCITDQNNSDGPTPTNISTGTGFFHLVLTAARGETPKCYWQGSQLGIGSGSAMAGADDFNFDRSGIQSDTNAWFGTSNYDGGTYLGQIGVFRLYNSSMPASSVTSNYNFYSAQF